MFSKFGLKMHVDGPFRKLIGLNKKIETLCSFLSLKECNDHQFTSCLSKKCKKNQFSSLVSLHEKLI